MSKRVVLIRQARVEFFDPCQHTGISREEFFNDCGLKRLVVYGLTLESDDYIKVLYNDDQADNEECEGIVIPTSSVIEVVYLSDEKDIKFIPDTADDDQIN